MTTEQPLQPLIYVACLASYNSGRYHGVHIDATKSADGIQKSVDKMLSASKEPYAEEWAIHDCENFYEIRIREWESFEKVSEIANALVEHGSAYSAYIEWVHEADASPQHFQDVFLGKYDSGADFAEHWCDEYYPELEHLLPVIDYESTWRELDYAGYVGSKNRKGFFVFDSNR